MGTRLDVAVLVSVLFGALGYWLLSGAGGSILLGLVAIVASVFFILEPGWIAKAKGIGGIVLALVGLLFAFAPYSTENGEFLANPPLLMQQAFLPAVLVLMAAAFVAARWDDLEPRWLAIAGAALAVVAAVLFFVLPIESQGNPTSIAALAGIVALLSAAPAAWDLMERVRQG